MKSFISGLSIFVLRMLSIFTADRFPLTAGALHLNEVSFPETAGDLPVTECGLPVTADGLSVTESALPV
jgi:hypothetical protein